MSMSETNSSNLESEDAYEYEYLLDQGCSLLCHPFGVMLLEYYRKITSDLGWATGDSTIDSAVGSTCTNHPTFGTHNATNDSTMEFSVAHDPKFQSEMTALLQRHFFGSSTESAEGADVASIFDGAADGADDGAADVDANGAGSSQSTDNNVSKSKNFEFSFTQKLSNLLGKHCRSISMNVVPQLGGDGKDINWNDRKEASLVGNCDIAFSMAKDPSEKVDNGDHTQNSNKNSINLGGVVGILEVSLNGSGGLRKVTQALDYATSMCKPNFENADFTDKEYALVWTLHLNGSTQGNSSSKKRSHEQLQEQQSSLQLQKQTQKPQKTKDMEVRVYLCEISWDTTARTSDGDKRCLRSKYTMVWREYTIISDGTSPDTNTIVQGEEEEVRRQAQQRQQEQLQKGVCSIARAVAMVAKLAEWKKENTHERRFEKWELKGPNCVKVSFCSDPGKHFMLKVFDNRFMPTARSPYMWCDDTLCDSRLEVKPYFFLHEGCVDGSTPFGTHSYDCQLNQGLVQQDRSEDIVNEVKGTICSLSEDGRKVNVTNADPSNRTVPLLGNPRPARVQRNTERGAKHTIPFGQGTVVILRYKYIEGSHWPGYAATITGAVSAGSESDVLGSASSGSCSVDSADVGSGDVDLQLAGDFDGSGVGVSLGSPRWFLPILDQLKRLHEKGYVHGDVRLFNMIFGKPEGADEEVNAVLLDYDLGGKEHARTYPRGYRSHLADVGARAGHKERDLSSCDDVLDFINVLLRFQLKSRILSVLIEKRVATETKLGLLNTRDLGCRLETETLESTLGILKEQESKLNHLVANWKKSLMTLRKRILKQKKNESRNRNSHDESHTSNRGVADQATTLRRCSHELMLLESLLKSDMVFKGQHEEDDLYPQLYLEIIDPDLESIFNKAKDGKNKVKGKVATGSPDRIRAVSMGKEPQPR